MLFVLVLLVVEEEDDKTIGLVKIKSKRKNTERFFREFIFFLRGEREREREEEIQRRRESSWNCKENQGFERDIID